MRSRTERKCRKAAFRFVTTDLAVAIAAFAGAAQAQSTETPAPPEEDAAVLTDMVVSEDPLAAIANESSGASIGFTKPVLETPRTVSLVSSEQISLLGISSVDDLTRVVPGTYTTTRYGLQGGINVRGVAADMYFRGMKRINMQGHARTSLASMDSIEVVKGPPSPIYGMGKIGGYSNLTPKAGRAKIGTYLEQAKGFAQVVGGDYNKSEASMGAGGPLSVLGKTGGYYVYGLLEDSDTFVKKVSVEQRLLQGAFNLDNFIGPFRLEAGTQAQNSITSGAYMNRVTPELIKHGKYVRGLPLVNLDAGAPYTDEYGNTYLIGGGDGAVGFRETHTHSPIVGNVSGTNRPLSQRFAWPTCGDAPCEVGQFPQIPGIPQAMMDYLNAHPEADPTGLLRAQGVGGPVPLSGQLPVGFVLDPRTVSVVEVDWRGNGAYEREQNARLAVIYADLVYDPTPDFTVKAQFFHDFLDSFKNSYLPYGEKQDIHVWEEKITVTKRIPDEKLPEWLRINTLASVNYRETNAEIFSSGGDFDWRQDIMYQNGDHYPNTIFWNQLDNDTYETGAPRTRDAESTFTEMGLGLMFDVDLFTDTNLVLGGRIDGSEAESIDYRRFNENASTDLVATYLPEARTEGWDDGTSWSASISHNLFWGLRPYGTLAKSSVALDGANNLMARGTVDAPGGHIGEAELEEFGIKGSWYDGRLFATVARYKQTRTDISNADDPTEGAEVSSTETIGIEAEIKWNPIRNFSLQGYAIWQEAEYLFATNENMMFTARELGFMDVVDPATGKVIYPAEAFLFGGRPEVTLPAELSEKYKERQGNPEEQYGLNMTYNLNNGLGFLLGGNYFSSTYLDRTQYFEIPSSFITNAAVTLDRGPWHLKVNGYNIFDELQLRARNSDTGPILMSVLPGARYEVTVRMDF